MNDYFTFKKDYIKQTLNKIDMLHAKNNQYRLFYQKGYFKIENKKKIWVRTKWYVLDINDKEIWFYNGKLLNKPKEELRLKFNLNVKTN